MDTRMDLLQWSIILYKKSAAYTSGGGIKMTLYQIDN